MAIKEGLGGVHGFELLRPHSLPVERWAFCFLGKELKNEKIIAFWQNSYLDNHWSCGSSIPF